MASRVQTDIHTSMHTVIQTDGQTYRHTYLHTYILTDILTCKQSAPRQASRQALGLWKLPAARCKLQQHRHFARLRQASRQAVRVWKLPLILLLKAACLWSCIFACVCSHSLCIKLPWPTLLTIRYLIYIYIYLSVTP